MTCARLVIHLIAQAVAGKHVERLEPPGEDELIAILAEKVRMRNVAAIRTLLVA
jgi:hypothetical protein